MLDEAALRASVAARYRGCGRFAFHYVAEKLRRDPLTGALLALGAAGGFGEVADLGCGRGQFAALLLEAGLACRVTGLDANHALLHLARRALLGLPFDARLQDLANDRKVPDVDTVLMLDVLYQMPTAAQAQLLHTASRSARRAVIIRTPDPTLRGRARLTKLLEQTIRSFWPHSGATVNAQPVNWMANQLTEAGMSVDIAPCWAGTPFNNVLLVARHHAISVSDQPNL